MPYKKSVAIKRLSCRIHGLVQGVGFRYAALLVAEKLHIQGFIENEQDGSIRLEAQGNPQNLERFLAWIRKGPPGSRVDRAVCTETPSAESFASFAIRYD